jgi:Putative neutral zinc metallopeptidase
MITRRDSVLGGLLTMVWTAGPCLCRAQEPQAMHNAGCTLDDDEAERLFTVSTEPQLFFTGNEEPIAKSGDPQFDYALAQTLSRLADTFKVLPGFCYYHDEDAPNAYATPRVRMKRADGTVFLGFSYLKKLLGFAESPDAAVAAACAHEFGHILQYKHGLLKAVLAGQATAKRSELQADYFAGYFAGVRKLQKRDYPAAIFAVQAHAAGDFNVDRRRHHGSPDERAAAVVRGFEVGYRERRRLAEAIQIGMNYVSVL